jgi:hypothetical protein
VELVEDARDRIGAEQDVNAELLILREQLQAAHATVAGLESGHKAYRG